MSKINIFWFRRDLRLHDNAGLYHALKSGLPVLPFFIFDTEILKLLDDKHDRRVAFIHQSLIELNGELNKIGSAMTIRHGVPLEIFKQLTGKFEIVTVFTNHDYEPYAIKRDAEIKNYLESINIGFKTFKDQVIFEKNEILNNASKPYTVFTPYSNKWKEKLSDFYLKPYPTEKYFDNFYKVGENNFMALIELGFYDLQKSFPTKLLNKNIVKKYAENRNFPGIGSTSKLGVHLRFGTVSIRDITSQAKELSAVFLNELIWRDFYMMVLFHFPHTATQAFRKEFDQIKWRNDEEEFNKWCEGKTGYPLVDAGMRELNETGFMHNRVRMIAASFLTKHLLIDWRWGENYFAKKLLDYDMAANIGGWQWTAGCGTDAAPYFRVFNPELQLEKFDPDRKYILLWLPDIIEGTYPPPMVNHTFARDRALKVFSQAVGKL